MKQTLYFILGFALSAIVFMFIFWTTDLSTLDNFERGAMVFIGVVIGIIMKIANTKHEGGIVP